MPTRAGIATVICAVVSLIAGRIFGIFELYVVAAAMLALVACASLWVLLNWRSLGVSRVVRPARLHAGDTSTVTLSLTNGRLFPTPVARITDEVEGTVRADAHVPPIRHNATTRASYRVPTETRGRIEIGPMKTRVTDPFGLASSIRSSAPDTSLLVLPKVDKITPPPQPGGDTSQRMDRSPNRVGANGEEFSSLRSYVVGDDLRKVHWPSTARSGEMVVRNEHIPEHGHSLVVLDVRAGAADEDTFERMVSAAASVIVACYSRGDRVRLVTTAGVDHVSDSHTGVESALDILAIVDQTPSATVNLPFRLGRAGTETGAMIVSHDADTLIASLPNSTSGTRGTFVVRFHGEGAKANTRTPRLPSGHMIDIQHGEKFAAAWNRTVGISSARAL